MQTLSLPPVSDRRAVARTVLDLDRRLEPLDRAILVADWDLQTGRSTAGPERWQLRRSELLSGPRLLAWVRRARTQDLPEAIARRLELLERIVLEAKVEQHPEVVRVREALQREIVRYRPVWRGRRVNREVVFRAQRHDPDPGSRRKAYYALEPLYRRLEPRFARLVRLRNARAKAIGYRSLAHLRLSYQGFTPEQVEEFAEKATAGARARVGRVRDSLPSGESGGGWFPWDFAYAQLRRANLPDRAFPRRRMMPTVLRAVRRWGFPPTRLRFRVVFHDLPAGGLTLAPDPPKDVRILVHPRGGWSSYMVMFHEVGHAVQSASITAPRHLLRWHENVPGFGGFHEGIGGLFEAISREPAWLVRDVGIPRPTATAFVEERRDTDLFSTAFLATWILPELNLYLRPERDGRAAGRSFARRLFGFDDYPLLSPVDSFYVGDPLYSVNYLLAHLFHYQIAAALRDEVGGTLWPNPRVGPWLTRNWFAPGSLFDWVPHVREVTGRPFGPRAFVDWFHDH